MYNYPIHKQKKQLYLRNKQNWGGGKVRCKGIEPLLHSLSAPEMRERERETFWMLDVIAMVNIFISMVFFLF